MSRLIIIGAPRTGKTSMAMRIGAAAATVVRHTDDLIGVLPWSEVSQKIADQWLTEPGPWIIEGVAAVRALRKWLLAHPTGQPCETIIVCEHAWVELTPGQARMATGHATIWAEIEPALIERGVAVEAAS